MRLRTAILLIKGATSLTNVEVLVFPQAGGMAQRFFYSVLYERGEIPMWAANGSVKAIEFGTGDRQVRLTDLNGTYIEFVRVREEDGKLKRSIQVMKEDKTKPSGLTQLLYENDP
jgi:hypothetical protein